jgi:hypothetical protein
MTLNKLDYITGKRRQGHISLLSTWKKTFKQIWDDMSCPNKYWRLKWDLQVLKTSANTTHTKKKRAEQLEWIRAEHEHEPGTYHMDMLTWSCICPSYLLNRFLLCKHLVQAVQEHFKNVPQHCDFFATLHRCYHAPYYYIEGLHDACYASEVDDINLAMQENMREVSHNQHSQVNEESTTALTNNFINEDVAGVANPDPVTSQRASEQTKAGFRPKLFMGKGEVSTHPKESKEDDTTSTNESNTENGQTAIDLTLSSDPFDDLASDEPNNNTDSRTERDDSSCANGRDSGNNDNKSCGMMLRKQTGIKHWQCVDGVGRVGPKQPHLDYAYLISLQ